MTKLNLGNKPSFTDAKDPPGEKTEQSFSQTQYQNWEKPSTEIFESNKIAHKDINRHSVINAFDADENQGTIGTFSEKETDNISDNFFNIQIAEKIDRTKTAFLEYDLFGLDDYTSVSRSINHDISIGGEVIRPNADWSHQKEEINIDLLKSGKNTILFTPPSTGIKYKIKNLRIVFSSDPDLSDDLNISSILSSNKLYVRGYSKKSQNLKINNETIENSGKEFEKLIDLSEQDNLNGTYTVHYGTQIKTLKIPAAVKSFKIVGRDNYSPKTLEILDGQAYDLSYEHLNVNVEKGTSESALVKLQKLRDKDFPSTTQGIKNVTPNNSAYRISLESGSLSKKLKVSMSYDERKLGQTSPKDIRVFYFDYNNKQWKIESSVIVDEKLKLVVFNAKQDNDYISGIISVPESPTINSFVPTSISGLKSADPLSGVQLMAPPIANQKGDAAISYPIQVPAGTNGMQPQLSITYSSDKGNGWMGEGWDISGVSGITLDTRWGTPTFDPSYESEIYLLDGEMLIYEGDYLPHRHINVQGSMDITRQARSSGKKNFYLRKNNNFTKIERYGSSPTNYTWVVTATDGTRKYYGGTESTVNYSAVVQKDNGAIVQWGIVKELDVHNNNIKYYYLNKLFTQGMIPISGENLNLEKGRQFHIDRIAYSGVDDNDGPYQILFSCKYPDRADYSINTKDGVKRVEIERLDNISVGSSTLGVRNYSFTYTTGSFYKSLLKSISGPGVNYQLDYYDDTVNGIFGPDKFVNAPAPDAFSGAVNSALTPSRISADNNFEWGWALRIGAGLGLFTPHRSGNKNFMVSGFVGESYPEIKRGQELLDFNGDGIVDILYRKRNGGNGIKVIPGSLENGNLVFNKPELNVLNLNSNFTKTKGSTFNTGATVLFNWWKMGFDFTKSWSESESKTPVYLLDANADGLPDVIKDDKVWFNKINAQGQPEMVTTSDMTENMVMKGSVPVPYTEPEHLDDDEDEEPVKAKNDVVKVWIAPKAGYVTIYDHISITNIQETKGRAVYSIEVKNPKDSSKNGRVYLTTLVGGNPNIDLKITKYDEYPGTPLGINDSSRIYVKSGDKIYFRLHKKTGVNYEINTTPFVEFVNANGSPIIDSPEEEVDDFRPNKLKYEENFVLNNLSKTLRYDYSGKKHLTIPGFSVPKLNDNVTFKITLSKAEVVYPYDVIVIYEKTYPQSLGVVNIDPVDMDFFVPESIPGGYHLKFSVISDSYMNKEIEWKNIMVTAEGNVKVLDVPNYPSYYVRDFKKKFHVADLNNNPPHGSNNYYISVNKNFAFSPSLEGNFIYVIKKGGLVLEKRWVKLTSSGITESSLNGFLDPIKFYTGDPYQSVQAGDRINIVVYCNSQKDRAAYESLKSQLQNHIFNIYAGTNTNLWASTVETAIFTGEFNTISAIYRNWGQFIYNESKDVRKTNNPLTPPHSPRDIPTGPSGVNTPDYTINTDTPKDSYGALINNEFLDSPFGMFNYDFSSCSGMTNQDEYGECIGDIIQADFLNIADTNILVGFSPIVPMTTHYVKGDNGIIEKWVNNGFTEQFSKARSSRDEESMAPFFVNDDPDEQDIEVQGNQNTGMYAIEKKQKSKAKTTNWGIGIPVISHSVSELRGYGNINTQDFFDVNGDGYPDMLYRTESQLTNSLGGLRSAQGRNLENNPDSVISNNDSFQKTNTIAFDVSALKTIGRNTFNSNSDSKPDSSSPWSGGLGVSDYPDSYDRGTKYWLDINGDGLVDRVELNDGQVKYKLNYGNGLVNAPYEDYPYLKTYESKPVGSTSVSIGGGLSGMISQTATFSSGWGISGSLTGSSSTGSSKVMFQDINGDGMIDLISMDNDGNTSVSYNMGNKFGPAQGLSKQGGIVNFGKDSRTYNGGLTLNGGFYINIPIVWLFGITILYLRAGADMSASIGVSMSEIQKGLRDVNGDGFPDLVVNNGNGLQVNYSRIGRTNKLSKVTEKSTNGTFTIDYEYTASSYNDPHSKLVMKEVKILNPNVDSDGYTTSTDKNLITRFNYQNSKYDRRERTNYGFEKVITEEMNGTNVYRRGVETFYNSNYYNNGIPRRNEVYSGGTTLKATSENSYKLYKYNSNYTQLEEIPSSQFETYDTGGTQGNRIAIVLPSGTSNTTFENGGSITTSSTMTYNARGQLIGYRYNSNAATGSFYSSIAYHDIPSLTAKNILNIPSEIKVFNSSNTLVRQRNSEVDPNYGDLTKIKASLTSSQTADTEFTYDSFGNVKTVKDPVDYLLTYEYDPTGKYVTKVTDSFGVFSSASYDPRWDVVLESIDTSGNKITYEYDSSGRITNILAPKEIGISPYTVKYSYFLSPYSTGNQINLYGATTQNYDSENPTNPIETISLADFTGKIVQVKKDVFVANAEKVSVSGMTSFDLLGRPIKQYHPTIEAKDAVLNKKLKLTLSSYFSSIQYDNLDRPIIEIDEDGNVTNTSYNIEGTSMKKTVSQPQNPVSTMKSETLSDAEGRTVITRNYLGTSTLVSQYTYNIIGQLLSVKDPENIEIKYEYDLGGRRTSEIHPDHGTSKFTYNKAGKMASRSSANLNQMPPIIYKYNKNRITDITYPNLPNGSVNRNNVKYIYGTSGVANGRLISKIDGTGQTKYTYGTLGEIIAEERKVSGYNIPMMNFITNYEYDSWNRIKSITYPDGEIVKYKYDLGGNLRSIKSQQNGDYVKDIQYDEYEQRTKIINGNDTYSLFTYTPKTRYLASHTLTKDNYTTYLVNNYQYDYAGNVTSNINSAILTPNQLGGSYQLLYGYDSLNRLTHAVGAMLKDIKGDPNAPSNIGASYETTLTYTLGNGFKGKTQSHVVNGVTNSLNTYNNSYNYMKGSHMIESVKNLNNGFYESFKYDLNGNPIDISSPVGTVSMVWDEEDNMKAYFNKADGVFQYYTYDNKGDRTIKYNLKEGPKLYQNGSLIDGTMQMYGYKVYPNSYVVVSSDNTYTKHYYAGAQRIASRLADNSGIFNRSAETQNISNDTDNTSDIENEFKVYSEKVGIDISNLDTEYALNSSQTGLYYLHNDHLSTANFVTDANAVASQFFLNLPFGETFIEQQVAGLYENPYKFNAKELDSESGLYYYGARYYNPRLSIWYGVDPLAIYNPVVEHQFYGNGEHNSGFFFLGNLNPYIYTYQNPVRYIDPNGKQVDTVIDGLKKMWNGINPWKAVEGSKDGPRVRSGEERFQEFRTGTIQAAKGAATAEVGHVILDAAGIVDPTPVSDTANGIWYVFEGDWKNATISGVSIAPYIGDGAKGLKYGGKIITQIQKHHIIPQQLYKIMPAIGEFILKNSGMNLKKLPNRFHGNHPAYTNWVKDQIVELAKDGGLTKEGLEGIIKNANDEINKAYKEFKENGQSLNEYFKNKTK
ncbi:SpvB/TcaC N-terminal domain-containing protein [Chryseobacterium artocarpi]|nr:SpvB/TcaC N-terminal domain-containing protein [Chryseobacterium artocarpi]